MYYPTILNIVPVLMHFTAAFLAAFSYGPSRTIMRSCQIRLRPNLELFFIIATIFVLAVIALKMYLPTMVSAKAVHALGQAFEDARVDSVTYYALHGEWPKNNAQLQSIRVDADYKTEDHGLPLNYVKNAVVANGAIHLHFSHDLEGEVLTFRPALPTGGYASIIWVCGNQRDPAEWTVVGKDETTFDPRSINHRLW